MREEEPTRVGANYMPDAFSSLLILLAPCEMHIIIAAIFQKSGNLSKVTQLRSGRAGSGSLASQFTLSLLSWTLLQPRRLGGEEVFLDEGGQSSLPSLGVETPCLWQVAW